MMHINVPDSTDVIQSSTRHWFLSPGSSIIKALRTSADVVFSATRIRKTNAVVNNTVDSTGSLTDSAELLDSIEEEPKASVGESVGEQEVEKKICSALDETLTEWTLSHVLSVSGQEVERTAIQLLENAPEGFNKEQAFVAVCGMNITAAIKKVTLDAVKLMMEIRKTEDMDENSAIQAMLNGREPQTSEITASVKQALAGIFELSINSLVKTSESD